MRYVTVSVAIIATMLMGCGGSDEEPDSPESLLATAAPDSSTPPPTPLLSPTASPAHAVGISELVAIIAGALQLIPGAEVAVPTMMGIPFRVDETAPGEKPGPGSYFYEFFQVAGTIRNPQDNADIANILNYVRRFEYATTTGHGQKTMDDVGNAGQTLASLCGRHPDVSALADAWQATRDFVQASAGIHYTENYFTETLTC